MDMPWKTKARSLAKEFAEDDMKTGSTLMDEDNLEETVALHLARVVESTFRMDLP